MREYSKRNPSWLHIFEDIINSLEYEENKIHISKTCGVIKTAIAFLQRNKPLSEKMMNALYFNIAHRTTLKLNYTGAIFLTLNQRRRAKREGIYDKLLQKISELEGNKQDNDRFTSDDIANMLKRYKDK